MVRTKTCIFWVVIMVFKNWSLGDFTKILEKMVNDDKIKCFEDIKGIKRYGAINDVVECPYCGRLLLFASEFECSDCGMKYKQIHSI